MWFQDGYQPSGQVEHVLPDGSSRIIINLDETPFRHFSSDFNTEYTFDDLILTGVHSEPVFLDSSTRISTIVIVLKEGAIPSLFKIPAIEFQNQVVPLEDLPLASLPELKEKLHTSSKPDEKLQVLEAYLYYQLGSFSLSSNPAVCYAVEQICNCKGTVNISEILDKTGYTRRWFIKLFRETVGITPKLFARIIRFQHSLDLLQPEVIPNFADIALQSGYYDQSHFNHDFREFSGISPMEYHSKQGKEKNHLFADLE